MGMVVRGRGLQSVLRSRLARLIVKRDTAAMAVLITGLVLTAVLWVIPAFVVLVQSADDFFESSAQGFMAVFGVFSGGFGAMAGHAHRDEVRRLIRAAVGAGIT